MLAPLLCPRRDIWDGLETLEGAVCRGDSASSIWRQRPGQYWSPEDAQHSPHRNDSAPRANNTKAGNFLLQWRCFSLLVANRCHHRPCSVCVLSRAVHSCNIWNEIPTAARLWKAVTCWGGEASATKIDQLHKLSRALKEFILLVWTSVAVLSKFKTQMVPRVAKLGKKNLEAIKAQLKTLY